MTELMCLKFKSTKCMEMVQILQLISLVSIQLGFRPFLSFNFKNLSSVSNNHSILNFVKPNKLKNETMTKQNQKSVSILFNISPSTGVHCWRIRKQVRSLMLLPLTREPIEKWEFILLSEMKYRESDLKKGNPERFIWRNINRDMVERERRRGEWSYI